MHRYSAIDRRSRIAVLIADAEAQRFNDPHKSLALCDEAIQLAKLDDPHSRKALAHSLLQRSTALIRLANDPDSFISATEALEIAESLGEKELIATAHIARALIYCHQGQHPDALQSLLMADGIINGLTSNIVNLAQRAESLNRMGWIYGLMHTPEKSLPYLMKSLLLAREDGNMARIANTLDSLCQIFLALGDFDKAFTYIQEGVNCARQCGTVDILAACLISRTSIHMHRLEYDQAVECSQEALVIAQSNRFPATEARTLRKLAALYQQQEKNDEALEYLRKALAVSQTIHRKSLIQECLHDLAMLYKKIDDYARALDYFEEFHAVHNEIFSEQADWCIKNLEVAYQVEQTKKENEINQQANLVLQKEIAERKEAQALAEKLATTDSLTELLNRRHFFHMAEREIKQAQRHNRPVALVMVDLDHFKNINDTYGHPTGDAVLKMVASVIQGSLRTGDIVCRYGGEEFAILMPETDAIKSDLVIKRIRKALSARKIETDEGAISVTFSAGIMSSSASQSSDAMNLEMLIKRADSALYEAKHAGRDRTVVCSNRG